MVGETPVEIGADGLRIQAIERNLDALLFAGQLLFHAHDRVLLGDGA